MVEHAALTHAEIGALYFAGPNAGWEPPANVTSNRLFAVRSVFLLLLLVEK